MLVDIGLKFYAVPSRPTWVTLRSRSQTHRLQNFVLKFLVKVFRSLYLLNMLMDQVHTLHVGRYWSEALCCTITTHLSDLEINVMGHRFLIDLVAKHKSGELRCPATALI